MCEDLAERHQDPATSQKTHTQYSHCITGQGMHMVGRTALLKTVPKSCGQVDLVLV